MIAGYKVNIKKLSCISIFFVYKVKNFNAIHYKSETSNT